MMKKNNKTYLCNLCGLDLAEVRKTHEKIGDEQYYRRISGQLADATIEAADVHICTRCVAKVHQKDSNQCW